MDAYILSAARTPIGKFLGELSDLPAPRLGAVVVGEAIQRAGVAPGQVDEVILGNVVQAGVGQAPARQAALFAGLPDTIAAYTVNKVCGSGLKAVMLAAQAIKAGDAQVIVAGGMESMSNAPFLLPGVRKGYKYGDQKTVDALVHDGLWCPFENCAMGDSADYIAEKYAVSRADQDRFSAQSHRRAAAAWDGSDFTAEVVPVTIGTGAKARTISRDEGIRADSTPDGLARLRPALLPGQSPSTRAVPVMAASIAEYPVQRHRFPFRHCGKSRRSSSPNVAAVMIIPAVQNPHWNAPASRNACCIG